jgi:hypothetical protein
MSLLIIAEGDRWFFHVCPLLLQTVQNIVVRETWHWIGHCDLADHQSQDVLMMASAGENVMDLHSVSVISGNIVNASLFWRGASRSQEYDHQRIPKRIPSIECKFHFAAVTRGQDRNGQIKSHRKVDPGWGYP